MKLSSRSEYALLALVYLSRHNSDGFVSVETIASGQAKSRRAKQELTEGMCCNFGGVGW